MLKLTLGIEYKGSNYHGWQRQQNAISVQEKLDLAVSKMATQEMISTCAGRTDTGVHALAQVVHYNVEVDYEPYNWVMGCNSYLPADIRVLWAKYVPIDFHARFSATKRKYVYLIWCGETRPGILHQLSACCHNALDVTAMAAGSQYLLGQHDFSSFRSSDCQSKTAVRHMYDISIKQQGNFIVLSFEANGFLHNMIRILVGMLLKVGRGDFPPEWVQKVLLSQDRRCAAKTMEASGLYLAKITYPEKYELPVVRSWLEDFIGGL